MDTRGTGAFTGQSAKQRRDESTSTERMQLRTYRHDGQGCFTFGQRGVHGNGASHRARAGGDDAAQVRHRHADAEGGERHRECPLMAHLPREIKTEKQAHELVVTSRQPRAARTPKQAKVERNRSTRFCEVFHMQTVSCSCRSCIFQSRAILSESLVVSSNVGVRSSDRQLETRAWACVDIRGRVCFPKLVTLPSDSVGCFPLPASFFRGRNARSRIR